MLISSDLRHAAVHEEFDAVDEAAVVRREEHDRFGDFVGDADATERNGGSHGVQASTGAIRKELLRIAEIALRAWPK